MWVPRKGLQASPDQTRDAVRYLTRAARRGYSPLQEKYPELLMHFPLVFKRLTLPLLALFIGAEATAKPQLAEGMYRVDWNRKVRDLCIDAYTNEDLTARDWQGVVAVQGTICKLSDVREGKSTASWTGACSQPGRGSVLNLTYKITIKVNPDESFDFLTVLSGDQQATIPIRGERLKGPAAKCAPDSEYLRPWQ